MKVSWVLWSLRQSKIFTFLPSKLQIFGIFVVCQSVSLSHEGLNPTNLIIIGCVIIFLAVMGCGAAYLESPNLILTHSAFMFCLVVVQVVIACGILDEEDETRDLVKDRLTKMFDNPDRNHELIDEIQRGLHCCGVKGPKFFSSPPTSCCSTFTFADSCTYFSAYQEGCLAKLQNFVLALVKFIAYLILGVSGVQVSFCFVNSEIS